MRKFGCRRQILLGALVLGCATNVVFGAATTVVWTNANGDGLWSTGSSWGPTQFGNGWNNVDNGITVEFGAAGQPQSGSVSANVNGGNPDTGGIQFDTAGWTITGGATNVFYTYGTTSSGAGTNTIQIGYWATSWGSASFTTNAGNKLIVQGNIVNGGSGSGTGILNKGGAGTLVLTGANTYTGVTTVNAGTLQIGNGTAAGTLGTGAVTVNSNGTLTFDRSDTSYSIANAISGSGALVFLGTGGTTQSSYDPTGNNSGFTGTISVNKARLQVNAVNDVGNASSISVVSGGQVYMSGGSCSTPLNLAGNGWVEAAGTLGALRLDNNTTYSGAITLTANAAITVHGGSTGNLTGPIGGAFQLELNSGASGNGTINVTPASGANTYGSTYIHNTGASLNVVAGNANAFSTGGLTMSTGGTLTMNGYSFAFANLSGAGGTIRNNSATTPVTLTVGSDGSNSSYGGTLADGSTASLSLIKTGAGTQMLTGSNTFSGTTTVASGTLVVGGSISGTTNLTGGTLAGAGTVAAVTVDASSTLAPGAPGATGTLSASGNIAFAGGTFALTINTASQSSSLLSVAGNLALGATTAPVLSITDIGGGAVLPIGTTLTFASYHTGSWDGNYFQVGGNVIPENGGFVVGSNAFQIDYQANLGGGISGMELTVVPEPSTFGSVIAGLGLLAGMQRFSRRRR